jgi:hypothetical protein
VITADRAGWYASSHIFRVTPAAETNVGLLYLACTTLPIQQQIKAFATGSVVDALTETDVAQVLVPYPRGDDWSTLGDRVISAWRDLALATAKEDEAMNALEAELGG